MPKELSAIDNAKSNFCVLSAKGGAGHLLYSMDVGSKQNDGTSNSSKGIRQTKEVS